MHKCLIATLSAGALLAAVGSASADTTTSTFNVTATVLKNCLVSSTDLAFGNYTPNAGALSATSSITVRCTRTTPYAISLNAGASAGSTYAQRLLASGAEMLEYNLYTTAGLTTVWGDGSGGTGTVAGAGNGVSAGAAVTHTVHGQLPDSAVNQDAPPGSYSDTLIVTVTY